MIETCYEDTTQTACRIFSAFRSFRTFHPSPHESIFHKTHSDVAFKAIATVYDATYQFNAHV